MPTGLSQKPGRSRERSLSSAGGPPAHVLSPQEVISERLALAADMLRLVQETPLTPSTRQTVRRLHAGVLALRGELRERPRGA